MLVLDLIILILLIIESYLLYSSFDKTIRYIGDYEYQKKIKKEKIVKKMEKENKSLDDEIFIKNCLYETAVNITNSFQNKNEIDYEFHKEIFFEWYMEYLKMYESNNDYFYETFYSLINSCGRKGYIFINEIIKVAFDNENNEEVNKYMELLIDIKFKNYCYIDIQSSVSIINAMNDKCLKENNLELYKILLCYKQLILIKIIENDFYQESYEFETTFDNFMTIFLSKIECFPNYPSVKEKSKSMILNSDVNILINVVLWMETMNYHKEKEEIYSELTKLLYKITSKMLFDVTNDYENIESLINFLEKDNISEILDRKKFFYITKNSINMSYSESVSAMSYIRHFVLNAKTERIKNEFLNDFIKKNCRTSFSPGIYGISTNIENFSNNIKKSEL